MNRNFDFFYIGATIVFTVYGQLILKWRVAQYGTLPEQFSEKIYFLFNLLLDPFIFSGFVSAISASFFWMAAMTKFDLSYAYPFMSLSFVFVFFLSALFFHESITLYKALGLVLIVAGILVSSRSI